MKGTAGRPVVWIYRLRRAGTKGASLAVPREVAEKIPADVLFKLSVTDNGLLYEPVIGEMDNKPKWMSNSKEDS